MGEQITAGGCATPRPRPLWQRVIRWFFAPYSPWPFPDYCQGYPVTTEIVTVFDWKDRLRVLMRGRAETRLVVIVENEPGAVRYTKAEAWVPPPV